MSLAVYVAVPDGIVVAADSLSTLVGGVQVHCPNCQASVVINTAACPHCGTVNPLSVPTTYTPYSQKLFQIGDRPMALTSVGTHYLAEKSVATHLRQFVQRVLQPGDDLSRTVIGLTNYLHGELLAHYGSVTAIPPDLRGWLLLAGYDARQQPCLYEARVSQTVWVSPPQTGYQTFAIGDTRVVQRLWIDFNIDFRAFNVQDAIDYARFLIQTTIDFQRYDNELPTCGGPIDVAVLNLDGFHWITRKELNALLNV